MRDLLRSASTPGDFAAVLLGGSVGLVLDAALLHVGVLSPGTFGIASASASLGLKKGAEATINTRAGIVRRGAIVDRTKKAEDFLRGRQHGELANQIEAQRELHATGVIDDAVLEEALKDVLVRFKSP